jgi:hypothetical protein
VDVEGSLLCDVLPDGTVAGQALVEAVYDTTSGDRVGTRTVDPATGAAYAPQGTLQPCPPPDSCTCETLLLCDVTEVTTPGETPERITNGTFPADASGWTLTGGARYVPSSSPDGSVGFLDLSADNNPAGSAEQTVTVTPGLTYNLSARIGIWGTGGTTPQSVLVEVVDGAGTVLHSQTVTPVEISGGPQWPADGVVGPVPIVATDTEMTVRFTDQVGGDFIDALVDDVSLLGPGVPGTSETAAVPFLRTICRTCTGTATVTDTTLDGVTVYAVQGVVGVCGPTSDEEPTAPLLLGQVCYDDGTGTVRAAAVVRCAGCDDPAVRYVDVETGAEVTAPAVVPCVDPATTVTDVETWPLCVLNLDGSVLQHVRAEQVYDAEGTPMGLPRIVDAVTGGPVSIPGGATLGVCPDGTLCDSPTTPVTSVGLCLADGTPIAVTVVRDCDANVTSEGWLNLVTGAWSAGAVPAGTVACGDARSIQVSGTFCDVLPDGTVAGLVLVEYSYDDTGAISSVRLVDAVTGGTYTPTGTVTTCPTGTEQPEQDAVVLCDVQADGTVTQFVRDYRRDELGAIVGHTDYLLDGTPYAATTGTVGVCQSQCQDCETLLLCAEDPATITGQGLSSGTLPNGVAWQTRASLTAIGSSVSNADGAWWGNPASFPNVQVTPYTFTFSEPSVVEFSVYMGYIANPTETDDNCMQLPVGLEVVSLPTGWNYNAVTGLACVNLQQAPDPTGANLANPTKAVSARFRTPGPVSTLTTLFLGPRRAVNGAFRTSWVGALQVTPSVQFLRRICRDCEGMVTAITDTLLDGTTAYAPPATVKVCQPTQDQPQGTDVEPLLLCHTATADGTVTPFLRHFVYNASTGAVTGFRDTQLNGTTLFNAGAGTVGFCTDPQPEQDAVLLCHTATDGTVTEIVRDYRRDDTGAIIGHSDYTLGGATFDTTSGTVGQCRPVDCTSTPLCVRPSGTVEFISNADNNTDGRVDPVWKWSLGSLAGPWYDMYQVGVYPGWTVTDSGTAGGTAHWVAQHPDRTVTNTGLPGEGPTMTPATPDWYARASFDLPPFADPATIKVSSTVLNADQIAVEWRLNAGPWQAVNRNHAQPAYTFGPAAVPGAQAGTNTLYLHGQETVFGSGASGVMMHLVVTYDVDATAFEQWLRTTCSDGTITYLDGDGNPQPGIPADSTIVPCPGGTGGDGFDVETWPLCVVDDATGDVLQRVRAEQVYDTTGTATGAPRFVDAVTGDAVTLPAGSSLTTCPAGSSCSAVQVTQLCDVVSAPPPPIPIPASGFTLTGNVFNSGGILVFSQGNVAVNGVVERTVSGLVPGFSYEVLFDSGWGGGGFPLGTRDAMYRAEVLDGATVLTTRDTNLSNGSTVNGPLTADTPLAFTAPASGAVNIRFTDRTVGDGSGRDLHIRPLPVQTNDPIVTATPFLRAISYDCDGQPTGSTDWELDGTTAYVLDGEAGTCPTSTDGEGNSTTASGRQLVERCGCDQAPGGLVRYIELWSVDPDGAGAPVLVGTYEDGDFTLPYEPVSPVDCPADAVVSTTLTGARAVTGTAPQDLVTEFPGLQSVTLIVHSGTALATLSAGVDVPFPAGVSGTWSVGGDGLMDAASFAGADAGTSYLLLWTYTA